VIGLRALPFTGRRRQEGDKDRERDDVDRDACHSATEDDVPITSAFDVRPSKAADHRTGPDHAANDDRRDQPFGRLPDWRGLARWQRDGPPGQVSSDPSDERPDNRGCYSSLPVCQWVPREGRRRWSRQPDRDHHTPTERGPIERPDGRGHVREKEQHPGDARERQGDTDGESQRPTTGFGSSVAYARHGRTIPRPGLIVDALAVNPDNLTRN
jgi:hypothetical protein